MTSTNEVDYLVGLSASVAEFLAVLDQFLALHHEYDGPGRGLHPAIVPRAEVDSAEIEEAANAVARAAGRAAAAGDRAGIRIGVQGVGEVDPIRAWHSMTQPKPVLEPSDVRAASNQIIGVIEALIEKARYDTHPGVGFDAFHPLIVGTVGKLWSNGHRRLAVESAAAMLASATKIRLGRPELSDSDTWSQAFSSNPPAPDRPRLRWRSGDATDDTARSMNEGLNRLALGLQMVIRNPAAHDLAEMSQQEGLNDSQCSAFLRGGSMNAKSRLFQHDVLARLR